MRRSTVYLLMAVHVSCAAVTYVLGKRTTDRFHDMEALAMMRATLASLLLLAMTGWAIPAPRFTPREWLAVAGLGVLLVPLNQWMFLRGMHGTVPGHLALLYAMTPVGVLLLQSGVERRAPSPVKALGVLVACAGVFVLLRPWVDAGPDFAEIRHGDLWILVGTVVWVVYTVASAPMMRAHDPRTVTAWVLVLGTIALLPFGGPSLLRTDFAAIEPAVWVGIAWLAAVTSVTMMLLWNAMLRHIEPVQVAICSNLQPIVTTALGAALYAAGVAAGTPDLGLLYWLGTALILTGVILAQRRRPPPAPPEPV